jgi:type VI secretion system secreted protein VgrG
MALSQHARIAILNTPLGKDVLVLNRVVISEQLSQPFRIEADLLSENGEIKFEDIIGKSVTITMMTDGDKPRYFNGIVSRFSQMGMESRFEAYRAEIVPQFWVLTRTYQSRIFQKKTVREILEKVLTGITCDWSLRGDYQPRDYCVQYRETDFNFASRLMEEEGIYYFFKHQDGQHRMVIADNKGAHEVLLPDYATIAFRPYTGRPTGDEFIYDWTQDKVLLPATYTHTDYDFESPKKGLIARSEKARNHAFGSGEWYDYPGLHTAPGVGEKRARLRAEEMHARYDSAKAKADSRGLQTGFVYTMIDHPRADQNGKHLVTSSVHTIQLDAYESGDTDRGAPYHCSFTTIPADVPFRPQRTSAKPFVQGPQTAVVVGPAGEEIYTDKYGRVVVQFHWDRDGKKNQNSSCWVRVSQLWAGKGWGGMAIPRIGQEVIVDFLEGDPDQPIIVGRVYNGECMPPFGLPVKKMVTGITSNSTPGGGGYNEISLDDTKNTEKIIIHAQFDMETTILHDETETVGNNRTETVGANHTETIGKNQSNTVGTNETTTIGADRKESVGANETISIGKNRTETVGGAEAITIGKDKTVTVGKNYTLKVADSISIVCGSSSITMKKDGTITIKGKDLTLDGSGKIVVKASSDVTMKGSKVAIN